MAAEGDETSVGGVEVPFQVGISDSELDLSNADERERWLRGQPIEAAMVIAARAALRAVPGLSLEREEFEQHLQTGERHRKAIRQAGGARRCLV
jgi:hypothetical protein